jgi:hypothetical protein
MMLQRFGCDAEHFSPSSAKLLMNRAVPALPNMPLWHMINVKLEFALGKQDFYWPYCLLRYMVWRVPGSGT